jgi:cellulose synthase/poly-beta-1,6-N-acetylglucosamine synthase-like glycosyltransferase
MIASELVVSLLFIPMFIVCIDVLTQIRARVTSRNYFPVTPETEPCYDYTIIVPIYGNIRYLENVDYLKVYGDRVLLTTSRSETDEFYSDLYRIARAEGFRVHISSRLPSPAERAKDHLKARATGGTLRDTIVLDAHGSITSSYVVCIDADTVTDISLDFLVGTLKTADLDIASVILTPANTNNVLTKLQAHEYRMAMRIRRVMPWLISGGCHVAKRSVHRDLMERHSLFFQGNDVEIGLLANLKNYRVGHIPFIVPTTVPDRYKAWFRQRKAWAGGEFRLMIVNVRVSRRHPFLYLYGGVVVIALLPMRWYFLLHPTWPLFAVLVLYLASLILVNWSTRDWVLLVYPFYSLFYSLVMVPIGVVSYVEMAVKFRNLGMIRAHRGKHVARYGEKPAVRIVPRPSVAFSASQSLPTSYGMQRPAIATET